jgi:hypothetical protein
MVKHQLRATSFELRAITAIYLKRINMHIKLAARSSSLAARIKVSNNSKDDTTRSYIGNRKSVASPREG